MRRTRRSAALRALVAETGLDTSDLIYPVFVLDGEGRSEAVESMPGISRLRIDGLLKEARRLPCFRSSMMRKKARMERNARTLTASCSGRYGP
jgi:delta-aminolevulinic acid dehydratase/porphobilinogen synthase